MYIECQECDTTFRLDESLLKPTGSKVRCSQCGNIFIALPPSAAESTPVAQETAAPTAPPSETEPSPVEAPAADSPAVEDGDTDLGLQDVDLAELDSLIGQDQETPAEEEAKTTTTEEVEVAAELDESDFEIDFEAALEADDSIMATPTEDIAEDAEVASDEMDLELDFDLGDDSVAEEVTPTIGEGAAETAQDIQSDLDKGDEYSDNDFELALDDVDLDEGGDDTVLANIQSMDLTSDDGLDLGIDQDATVFAPADESEGDKEPSELDIDLEAELDLDLDMEDESDAAPAAAEGSEEVDDIALNEDFFSDLDSILEDTSLEGPDDAEPKEEVELELDEGSDEPAAADSNGADEDLEELSFELDAEYEDKPIAQADESEPSLQTDDDADEIDLSEIELMLEGDSGLGGASAQADEETGERTSAGDDFDLDLDDEIDLAELTAAIDSADLEAANDTATIAEDELELALAADDALEEVGTIDIESDSDLQSLDQPEATEISEDHKPDDELDLSDLDDLVMEQEPSAEQDTPGRDIVDSGDIELEFQIEEEEDATPQVQEHLDTLTPHTAPPEDQTFEMPEAVDEPEPTKRSKPKKKGSKILPVILILILLGAIGYGVYYADTEMGIKIPYVSDYVTYVRDYVTPPPKDPAGTVNLSTLDINSKFIENEQSGRLFVITGQVHNGYQHGRGQIRLQGKLFTKGKVLAQTEWAFAGHMLEDQVLATTPFAEIKNQLATPPQQGTPGARVQPNQNLPFMVVFSNLPAADELEEFAVEVVKSIQIQ